MLGWCTLAARGAVVDLVAEARRCGGVFAAIVTALRRARVGDRIRFVYEGGQEGEVRLTLERLSELGMVEIVSLGGGEAVVTKRG
ncbi:hypothetical protein [Aeropyrum camini]|uniref:Metal-dependent protease n=1 Tax=Aeropyrum camini SY1 = JCM 12091 TaxID=1198449 RepID=U3TFP6_9CREN|nr:hypothetical protein [Aeropyrum camini]BAN90865.1 metal-dependent protease [Aeropyrum camini SY1 = JCM 12091]